MMIETFHSGQGARNTELFQVFRCIEEGVEDWICSSIRSEVLRSLRICSLPSFVHSFVRSVMR